MYPPLSCAHHEHKPRLGCPGFYSLLSDQLDPLACQQIVDGAGDLIHADAFLGHMTVVLGHLMKSVRHVAELVAILLGHCSIPFLDPGIVVPRWSMRASAPA